MISDERLREWIYKYLSYPTHDPTGFARTVEREARREALEEASKVCDAVWETRRGLETGTAHDCAAAIRALIDK